MDIRNTNERIASRSGNQKMRGSCGTQAGGVKSRSSRRGLEQGLADSGQDRRAPAGAPAARQDQRLGLVHESVRGPARVPARTASRIRQATAALLLVLAALLVLPLQAQDVTLVGNFDTTLGLSYTVGDATAISTFLQSQQFTTGANTDGYTLTSVKFNAGSYTGSNVTARVSIYSVSGDGTPGTSLHVLTGTVSSTGEKTFTAPSNTTLDASTSYFVVFEDTNTTTPHHVYAVSKSNSGKTEDSASQAGWEINDRYWKQTTGAWTVNTNNILAIELKGTVNSTLSTDATLSALALEDASDDSAIDLNENFASGTTSYTADTGSGVDQITVLPAKGEDNATLAYLDADDATLTDADSIKDDFQFDLDEGENTIKVKVTAQDTATVETYTLVVTRAAAPTNPLLVSNLGQAHNLASVIGSTDGMTQNFVHAQKFSVPNGASYNLSSVTINVIALGTQGLEVTIRDGSGTDPGTTLYTLDEPADLATGDMTFPARAGATLEAGEDYFIAIGSKNSAGVNSTISLTNSNAQDPESLTGWSIANVRKVIAAGGNWGDSVAAIRIQVRGNAIPASSDASLSDIELQDASDDSAIDLNENFASGTTDYTADADNDVEQITVLPAKGNDNATIQYLDENDATLADADMGEDDFQVDLDAGENTIKIKVTAQDTATEETYTLVVTRASTDPLWSTTMTVAESTKSTTAWGYGDYGGTGPFGSVGTHTFMYNSTSYRVLRLDVRDPDGTVNDGIRLEFDTALPDPVGLILEWAGAEFDLDDTSSIGATRKFIQWKAADLKLPSTSPLHPDNLRDTIPIGAMAPVCLRTSDQTCPGGSIVLPTDTDATGQPNILGTPQVGKILIAIDDDIVDANGLPANFPADYTLEWVRTVSGVDTPISGETSGTYTVTTADVGSTIKLNVSFIDGGGFSEGPLTSDPTETVVAAAGACPAGNDWCTTLTAGLAMAGGNQQVGYSPDISFDDLVDPTIDYGGETYTVSDLYYTIRDGFPDRVFITLDEFLPRNSVFNLGGTTFTANSAAELGNAGQYSWLRPPGFVWFQGQDVTVSVELGNFAATGKPGISGAAQVGVELTATTGDIADIDGKTKAEADTSGYEYSYQWVRVDSDGSSNPVDIGTDDVNYTPVAADEGKKILVKVSFTDDDDNSENPIRSDATETVLAATGACPADNDWCTTLTVGFDMPSADQHFGFSGGIPNGNLDDTTINYGSKTFTASELFYAIRALFTDRVFIKFNDFLPHDSVFNLGGTTFTTSSGTRTSTLGQHAWDRPSGFAWLEGQDVTVSVELGNFAATGKPGISGTAQAGVELTATTSGIRDVDGKTKAEANTTGYEYSYQWVSVDGGTETDITGETSETYTPVAADVGKTIKVKVSFKDDDDNDEDFRTSDATAAVIAAASTDAVWSTTMTVELSSGNVLNDAWGYQSSGSTGEFVDSPSFEYGSTTYTVQTLFAVDETGTANDRILLYLTPALPNPAGLFLEWADSVFDLDDRSNTAATFYFWDVDDSKLPGASLLHPDNVQDTIPPGAMAPVCLRTASQTCPGGSIVLPSSNAAPTFDDGASTTRSFNETIGNATISTAANIGAAVSATDTDSGDTLSYSLEGTDAAKFGIVSTSGQIQTKVGEKYDHEADDEYEVTVKVDDGNSSNNTATIDVTLEVDDVAEPPQKPATPTLTINSANEITVNLSAPNNTGRPAFNGILMRHRKNGAGAWTSAAATPGTLGIGLSPLDTAVEYEFRVRYENNEGNGPWSDSRVGSTASKAKPVAPAAPTVTATSGSTTSLDVSWAAPVTPAGEVARPAVSNYDLRYKKPAATSWTNGPQNQTGTSASIGSLDASEAYEMQVRAQNTNGNGAWSASGTGSTGNAAPTFDDGASTTRDFDETIGNATVATAANIGTAVAASDTDTGDTLTYSLEGTNAAKFGIVSTSGQIQTKVGERYSHEADNEYEVTVKVVDGNSGSDTIAVTIEVNDVDEPPQKPNRPTLSAISASSIGVSWTSPNNVGRPTLGDRTVRHRKIGAGSWNDRTFAGGGAFNFSGLDVAVEYEFQVRFRNAEGWSPWSDSRNGSTASKARPVAPAAPTVTATSGSTTSLDVNWAAPVTPAGEVARPAVSNYDLRYKKSADSTWTNGPQNHTGTTTVSIGSLEANVAYDIQVRAQNTNGDGAWSDSGSGSTSSVTLSTDATLSALTLEDASDDSAIGLNETFASTTTDYTADADSDVEQITVLPTRGEDNATLVYLDGDDATLTDADTGEDDFQVDIDEGDNTIKIKVTAQDTTTVETYTLVVTRAVAALPADPDTLVSNNEQTPRTAGARVGSTSGASQRQAQRFHTGDNPGGYTLTAVKLHIKNYDAGDVVEVKIRENNNSNRPGDNVDTLDNPTLSSTAKFYTFTPSQAVTLDPGEDYFVVIAGSNAGPFTVGLTDETDEDTDSESDWTIKDDRLKSTSNTGSWSSESQVVRMEITGTAVALTNTDATGTPEIDGTPQVGKVLTAEIGDIADQNGLPSNFPADYTLQWVRTVSGTDTNISTAGTYTVTAADLGSTIKLNVSFTDDGGFSEGPLTSDAHPANGYPSPQVAAAAGACPANVDWCSTMTVGFLAGTNDLHGFTSLSPAFGTLADNEFDQNGTTNFFWDILISEGSGTDYVGIQLDDDVPDGTVFNLGGTEFTTDVSSRLIGAADNHTWSVPSGFGWSEGQEVTVAVNLAPILTTAVVDGDALVLTYHEALDTGSAPAASAYSVAVDGAAGVAPSGVAIAGSGVTLTLATAVTSGQAVTVSYTVPTSNPVQDESGLDAAALSDEEVTNNTGVSNAAPTFDDGASTTRAFNETFGNATVSTAGPIGNAVSATDTDSGDTLTYSLEGTDASKFGIVSTSGQIQTKVGEKYDHEADDEYAVTVKVVDGSGGSDTIAVTIGVDDQNEPPLKPTAPTLDTPTQITALHVNWSPPNNVGRPAFDQVSLRYRRNGAGNWTTSSYGAGSGSLIVISLSVAVEYEFQVRYRNDEGTGPWSDSRVGSTASVATPVAPAAPTVTATSGSTTSLDVNWAPPVTPSGQVARPAVLHYDLRYKKSTDSNWTDGPEDHTGTTASIASLDANVSYDVQVRGENTNGNGLWSNSGSGSTDTATVTIAAVSSSITYDAGTGAAFTLSRTGATTAALTVSVNLTQDKPFLGTADRARTVTFAIGDATRNLTVSGSDLQLPDSEPVENGTLTATLVSGSGYSVGSPASADVDIVPFMTVRLDAASYRVSEAVGTLTVTVIARTGDGASRPTGIQFVSVSTASGTALFNQDFTTVNETLTFAAGDFSADGTAWKAEKTVDVAILDDELEESDEVFDFRLNRSPGLDTRVVLVHPDGTTAGSLPRISTVTIEANDVVLPALSFGSSSYAAAEGGTGAVVRVRLTPAASVDVTIALTTTLRDGATAADYSGVPSSVQFDAGETEKTFTVRALSDSVDDDGESLRLGFGPLPTGVTAGTPSTATVALEQDPDLSTWWISFDQDAYTATEGGAGAEVRLSLRLNQPPWVPVLEEALTVPLYRPEPRGGATSSDYSGIPASVTFHPGSTTTSFTVTATDDNNDDDGESVLLQFPSYLPGNLDVGRGAFNTTVHLKDNDGLKPVTVSFDALAYTAAEGGATATVGVRLDTTPDRTVTIPLTTTNEGASSSDYSGVPASLTFGASETVQTFTVTATDDNNNDDLESVTLGFGELPSRVLAGDPSETVVNLTDNDAAESMLTLNMDAYKSSTVLREVSEGISYSLHLSLDRKPKNAVTIPLQVEYTGGATAADVTGVPVNVTFEAGTKRVSLSVGAVDDTEADPGEGFVVSFGTLPAGVEVGEWSGGPEREALARFRIIDNDANPGLTISDASVREGTSLRPCLNFWVTLDRKVDYEVRVDYATVDGTALAGQDYIAASGTLVFWPSERTKSKRLCAEVINDSHDEGVETMTMVLSNPEGANLVDATATGRISNSGQMPGAWLARFGRVASDHVIEAVADRWQDGPQASHLTIGGRQVGEYLNWGRLGTAFEDNPATTLGSDPSEYNRRGPVDGGPADGGSADSSLAGGGSAGDGSADDSLSGRGPAGRGSAGRGSAGGGFAGGGFAGGGLADSGPAELDAGPGHSNVSGGRAAQNALLRTLGLGHMGVLANPRDLLMGSSFFYSRPLDEKGQARTGSWLGDWSTWGRTAASRFSGADGKLSLNGEVATAMLGVDSRWDRWFAGLVLSYSEGEGLYSQPHATGGTVDSMLTALHPYVRFELSERTSLWGMLGYGVGELSLTPVRSDTALRTGLTNAMAAFGGRTTLSVRLGQAGRFELAVRSDARLTNTVSDSIEGLVGTAGATSRVRLMLEGSGSMPLAIGGMLKPKLEAGVRYDAGDAETGAGLEIGGGLGYAVGRLGVEITGRALLAHQDAEYKEWGFSGSLAYTPGKDGRGLSMKLGSAWGSTQSGVQSLWTRQDASGLARNAAFEAAQRFQAELGYGIAGRGKASLWVPLIKVQATGGGGQEIRMGVRFTSGPDVAAGLEFGQLENVSGGREHAVQLTGMLLW